MTGVGSRAVIRLPYPHQGQQAVRSQARRFNWLCAGRRWRKTTLVMAVAVEAAAAGRQIVWGAPTYDQVFTGWEEARKAASGIASFRQSRMEAAFPGGGRIIYRSLDDPDNARSKTADGVVIDEAADVAEAAWQEVMRPMLIDTGGWLWAIGTPKGQNWFWREFVAAADRPDSVAWNAPTLGCRVTEKGLAREPHPLENPHIPLAEIEHLHATLPDRVFRQEILAEFIEDAGGVFRKVREAVDKDRTEPDAPRPGDSYAVGVDLARVEDFTVITAIDGTGRQAYFERFNQISWERQIEAIKAVAARYPGPVVVDSTGVGDPICETLRRSGLHILPYHFTNQSKEVLIDRLALRLEQGRLRLMDVVVQTNELLAYQYELTPSRNVRMNAPEGMHDDCVISLALASWAAERHALVAETPEQAAARLESEAKAKAAAHEQWLDAGNPHWWPDEED